MLVHNKNDNFCPNLDTILVNIDDYLFKVVQHISFTK